MSKARFRLPQTRIHYKVQDEAARGSFGVNITGFWRLYEIDRLISQEVYPNCSYLSDCLEVSRRTVERDIERLRDMFGAPIEYDRRRKGYYYSEAFVLTEVKLREGEAIALFLGQKLLMQCKGTPLEDFVKRAMLKIRRIMPQEIEVNLERALEAVSFHVDPLRGEEVAVAERYQVLAKALEERRTVGMEYYSAGRNAVSGRKINPYHLRLTDGAWYCIGFCHERREVRTFALDRILSLSITCEHFTIPASFSIEEYLRDSWTIERGTPRQIVIEFDSTQVPYIRERQWHHSQKIEALPSGGLRMALTTGSTGEIMRWVMSFGSHAKILEPRDLRQQIIEELGNARANYPEIPGRF